MFYLAHKAKDGYYKVCKDKKPLEFNTKEEAEVKLLEFIEQTIANPEYTGYHHFYDKLFIVEE